DVVTTGARPLFFLDYFATARLDVERAVRVIEGIAEGCKRAGCALLGGETAELPGMYLPGEYDLAGFVVGVAERSELLPRADVRLDEGAWSRPAIFELIAERGRVAPDEMRATFNLGLGFVAVVDAARAPALLELFRSAGERASVVGSVIETGAEAERVRFG